MIVYRFRITCEEHDSFLREIEILPNQTFLDFHHIMVESAELLHCDRASFFMADKGYKKYNEISLKAEKRQVRKYDEDLDQVVSETVSLPLMKVEKLKNYIEDPHQKLIYEFVGKEVFSFHIELYKIFPSDGIESYPRCIRRVGDLPKKIELPSVLPDAAEPKKPAVPRPVAPKPVPAIKFDELVESEEDLVAIEQELDVLIADSTLEMEHAETEPEEQESDPYLYESQGESGDDDKLDHMEDFEDLDRLDKRLSGTDRDTDDY